MDPQLTLPSLLYQRAGSSADRIALTSIGQGEVSWGQLWATTQCWAAWLQAHGVASGDRVAALVPQSLEAAYIWMGCSVIGAVEVSVNSEFRGEWLRNALKAASSRTVVTSRRFLDQLLPVLAGTEVATILVYDDPSGESGSAGAVKLVRTPPKAQPPSPPMGPPTVYPYETACVLYTSGTTGVSKAVQIAWAQLYTFCTVSKDWEREGSVYYLPYAAHHLAGRGALYRAALNPGGRSVIREVFSTTAFWDDVRSQGCTWSLLYATPARFLMNQPERADDRDNPLELVLMNPLIAEVDALKRRFAFEAFTVYGMTEIANPFVLPPEDCTTANAGCGGRPIAGVEARLVDEHDYPVPAGQPGELVVRSDEPWIFTTGYLGAPEATASVWRNGWFHTGDILRQDERGNYYYMDRRKDMIRRRGENISSMELEAAALSCPGVAEAAAVGVASSLGDEEVLLAVVVKPGESFSPEQLVSRLKEIVPRFAVPRYVRRVDALPRTPATLRVQKGEIRAQGVTADTWDRTATA